MTTRKILLAAATITLLTTGCAQKKNLNTMASGQFDNGSLNTVDGTTNGTYTTVTEGYPDDTGHYDNVDPYGNGNYGSNGTYSNNGTNGYGNGINGGYADGSKGYGNGNSNGGNNGYGNGAGGVQNVYFDVDQYAITSKKLSIISNNANLLRGENIKIEGHCDATGSDEYNYALGLRRAKAAKDAMVSNRINADNISLMSMGESSPACTSDSSAECYAQNRRVEFKVSQ